MNDASKICDAIVYFENDYGDHIIRNGALAYEISNTSKQIYFYFCSDFREMKGRDFNQRYGFKYTWMLFGFYYNPVIFKKVLNEILKLKELCEDQIISILEKEKANDIDFDFSVSFEDSSLNGFCEEDYEAFFGLSNFAICNKKTEFEEIEL